MLKKIIFITIYGLGLHVKAQTSMSLQNAIDYALKNHPEIQNKSLGIDYANAQVDEIKSIGLPQVDGSFQFTNNLQLPVFIFPLGGVPTAVRIGNKYSNGATVSASWLAFDGTYLLGLKATKKFVNMASLGKKMAERDIIVNVSKSYYMVLTMKENINLLEQNLKTLNATITQTEGLFKQGFVEKLDVDRLKLAVSNLEIQLDALKDQALALTQLLKLNMGMPIETPIELTDNLETLFKQNIELSNTLPNPKLRIEHQILSGQLDLNKLDAKRYNVSKYPNVVMFANYQQNNFGDKLDLGKWYGSSLWGFKVSVPIFDGFGGKAQDKKRQITLKQNINSIAGFENAALFEVTQAKVKYEKSLKVLELQKANLKLANDILASSTAKLKQGVGSNMEITNAQQEVKNAQSNYLNTIYELLNAQIDLKKALGLI